MVLNLRPSFDEENHAIDRLFFSNWDLQGNNLQISSADLYNANVAEHLTQLPLFPLHAVLFPFARIQLHVFEERYQQMIRYCEEFDSPFGVTLIRSGSEVGEVAEPFLVGTVARIEKTIHYPDGRSHISCMGENRFRVRRIHDEGPYLVGTVEPLLDRSDRECGDLPIKVETAIQSLKNLIDGMIARPDFNLEIQLPEDPSALSFVIANFLQIENIPKQRILESDCPSKRFDLLLPYLQEQLQAQKSEHLQRLTLEHLQDWITLN